MPQSKAMTRSQNADLPAPSYGAGLRLAMLAPISWRVPPRHYGPWERVVSLLTEELIGRGVAVTLFATADSITRAQLAGTCPRPYSEDGGLEPKVWECLHIAEVFDQYLVYRPEMIVGWEEGRVCHPPETRDENWQAELWRRLTGTTRPRHRARLAQEHTHRRRVLDETVREALEGHDASQTQVARPKFDAHRPAPDLFEDLVAAARLGRAQGVFVGEARAGAPR